MKTLFIALFAMLLMTASAAAQMPSSTGNLMLGPGVAAHKGLDDIYRQFGEGYANLDAAKVAGLYTDTAAYLAPGGEVQTGRQTILKSFTDFFDSVKRQKEKLEISFRVIQRQVDTNLAFDVGIFTLTSTGPTGASRQSRGKFIVVGKREHDGKWLFQVDGYSGMPDASK